MYIGLDAHKRFIQVAKIKHVKAPVEGSCAIKSSVEEITAFAKKLKKKDKVVLENNTNVYPIASILSKYCPNVVISNPMKTKMIADSDIKTDKKDAETLARLLASDYLYTVWQPSEQIISYRKIVAYYFSMMDLRIAVKNMIHSILHRNLIEYSHISELFNSVGRKYLSKVSLPEDEQFQLDMNLQVFDYIDEKIKIIKKRIAKIVIEDEESKRLMTLPGFNIISSLLIKAAVGDITRFPTPKKLVSYFGLNPGIRQSADKSFSKHITKKGSPNARWMLIQISQIAVRGPGPFREYYKRIKRRGHCNKAKVAVAQKIVKVIWHMLTKKEDYRHALPIRTQDKLSQLRIIATGVRLRSNRYKFVKMYGNKEKRLDALKHDHDIAIKAEQEYKKFIEERYESISAKKA